MNRKIAIVEDDADTLQVITYLLEEEGFDVADFSHVNSIEEIIKTGPGLILLDVWLEGMSGREIAIQLKADKRSKNIPVAFVSAVASLDKIALQCGVDSYIPKPFDCDELILCINNMIGN